MTIESLKSFLEAKASQVRSIEADAQEFMGETGDQEGYEKRMVEKAKLLAALADDAEPYFNDIDPALLTQIRARLQRFSSSAGNALSIGSVFYVYALLYPEDYREGEPNDLEEFIAGL